MTHEVRRSFGSALVLGALLGGCGSTGPPSAPPAEPTFAGLRVQGDKITDAAGKVIYLRGFQGLGSYPIPDRLLLQTVLDGNADPFQFDAIADDLQRYVLTDFDIEEIRSTGANAIRLWTKVYEIQRRPGVYSETALRLLEGVVNAFGRKGVYTILVMAGAGENNYEPQQVYLRNGIDLWDPASRARQDSIAVWGVLSRRFSENPHVAGYEVMNEPMPPTEAALRAYYADVIGEIRRHDENHMIILPVAQGHRDTFQIGGDYADPNIAVTFHFYEPHDFTLEPDIPSQTYPGTYGARYWDRAAVENAFAYAIHLPQLRGKPVYVGEFGAGGERDGSGGLEWTSDVLQTMDTHGLHYTYHNYKHRSHKGYWIRRPEAREALRRLEDALVNGTISYWDLTDEQKRALFMTEHNSYRREGIKELLSGAFSPGG